MATKLALVVDDSRMARYVLGKMLTEHGIDVESVESGEEALGYLCGKKPSMIFMDHTMPGMDGFQCLRAIKNDPHTAMIPIIMYTSKEGEVYESQARALGAVDVLPKNLKPLTLARVLERQNLLPNRDFSGSIDPSQAANDLVIVDQEPQEPPSYSKLEEHRSRELEALESKVEDLTAQLHALTETPEPPPPASVTDTKGPLRVSLLLVALLTLVSVWLAISNDRLKSDIAMLNNEKQSIEDTVLLLNRQNLDMRNKLEDRLDSELSRTDLLSQRVYDSIEWALNQDAGFGWNSAPFDEQLGTKLVKLADNLYEMGFIGVVNITSHLGKFCVNSDSLGAAVMPAAETLISSCDIMEPSPSYAESLGLERTPEFNNALEEIQSRYGSGIKFQLATAGTQQTLVSYPTPDEGLLASEWNEVAAQNQRVDITINPF